MWSVWGDGLNFDVVKVMWRCTLWHGQFGEEEDMVIWSVWRWLTRLIVWLDPQFQPDTGEVVCCLCRPGQCGRAAGEQWLWRECSATWWHDCINDSMQNGVFLWSLIDIFVILLHHITSKCHRWQFGMVVKTHDVSAQFLYVGPGYYCNSWLFVHVISHPGWLTDVKRCMMHHSFVHLLVLQAEV